MSQGTAVAVTTDTRRSFTGLRPFLLLGGFVVLWWCMATGTAQAAEAPHHDLGTTTKALGATADRVVHQTTHHAVDRVRHTSHSPKVTQNVTETVTQKVSQGIRQHVAPVRAAVVKTVQVTLTKTPVGAATAPVLQRLDSMALVGEFASLQGETRSGTAPSAPPVAPSPSATAGNDQAQAAPGSPDERGADQHPFLQTGSTGASSAQSGSGADTSAAASEAATVVAPAATKTSTNAPAGRPNAGPAYPPSSSPD